MIPGSMNQFIFVAMFSSWSFYKNFYSSDTNIVVTVGILCTNVPDLYNNGVSRIRDLLQQTPVTVLESWFGRSIL